MQLLAPKWAPAAHFRDSVGKSSICVSEYEARSVYPSRTDIFGWVRLTRTERRSRDILCSWRSTTRCSNTCAKRVMPRSPSLSTRSRGWSAALPTSATKYPAWWGNEAGAGHHVQAKAWLNSGREVESVDLAEDVWSSVPLAGDGVRDWHGEMSGRNNKSRFPVHRSVSGDTIQHGRHSVGLVITRTATEWVLVGDCGE